MCGIAAIISPDDRDDLHDRAQRMLDLIRHRGPDDSGVEGFAARRRTFPGQSASVALAANRLAIQDLTKAGHQPMSDRSGRYWLIFNGEIYNFLELRDAYADELDVYRSHGDTEVLLRLLVRHGADALPLLDGMFALVFFDLETNRIVAARDRFGIKPLYYRRAAGGSLALASEIKALTAAPGWKASANGPRVRDYLARGLIDHTDETLFEGVRQLPAGHVVEFDAAAPPFPLPSQSWFDLAKTLQVEPVGEPAEHLRVLLKRAVTRRLLADVTVGSCLSGGLDSSSIVCLAEGVYRASDSTIQERMTFTARSEASELDEWRFAQAAAQKAAARAVEVHPDAGAFFDSIDDLVWFQDEPFAGPSVFAQFAVFRSAREHGVTVMLDGQGADEQLAGYHVFFRVRLLELIRSGRLIAALRALRERRRVHGVSIRRQLAEVAAAWLPPGSTRFAPSSSIVDEIIAGDRLAPEWRDPFREMDGRRQGVRAFSIDQLTAGSLPMLLHWEDRSSMAHSVEARVPFLCPEVVAFVLSLPSEAKIDGAATKIILREAMRGVVPEEILDRTDKIAFATDDKRWFGPDNRDRLRPLLAQSCGALESLMHADGRAVLEKIADGKQSYDPILWRMICLGAWVRRFDVALP